MKTPGDQAILPELHRVSMCGASHLQGSVLGAEKAVPRGKTPPGSPESTGGFHVVNDNYKNTRLMGVDASSKGGIGAQGRQHTSGVGELRRPINLF